MKTINFLTVVGVLCSATILTNCGSGNTQKTTAEDVNTNDSLSLNKDSLTTNPDANQPSPTAKMDEMGDVDQRTKINIAGAWSLAERITSTDCPGETGLQFSDIITLEQKGTAITWTNSKKDVFNGTLSGNNLTWSGSYPDDGGTTTSTLTVELDNNGENYTGTENWSWTNGTESCSGVSTLSGSRLKSPDDLSREMTEKNYSTNASNLRTSGEESDSVDVINITENQIDE